MPKKVVAERGVCIRVACVAFRISESCYRYERKLDVENDEVAFVICTYVMSKALNGTTSACIESTRSWSSIYGSSLANALCARNLRP